MLKKEEFNKLVEKFYGCDTFDEVEKLLGDLKEGDDYKFVDEKIDDGIDDEDCEDEYIIKSCYYFYVEGEDEEYSIDFCYGNNTRIMGDIE